MFEKLIEALNRIASALEAQNAAHGVQPAAPASPAAEKKAAKRSKVQEKLEEIRSVEATPQINVAAAVKAESAPKAEPTVQDLIQAAQLVLASNGNDPTPLAAINARFGVKKLREIPVTAYAEVLAELAALTNANAPRA